MLTTESSTTEIDLNKLGFFFAIEQLEPRFGLVSASYVKYTTMETKQKWPIKLTDCSDFDVGGRFA